MTLSAAAAHKPKVTMPNGKHWLEGHKAPHHLTVEQYNGTLWSDHLKISSAFNIVRILREHTFLAHSE